MSGQAHCTSSPSFARSHKSLFCVDAARQRTVTLGNVTFPE
jgi:hypothetical protein